jgi:hypothetical protein
MLPASDEEAIRALGYTFETSLDQGMICVVIAGYELPAPCEPSQTNLLIRLPGTWPDGQPDMFWMDPPVRVNGRFPPAADHIQSFLGRQWQRWSRHLGGGWRPGDDLATWLRIVRQEVIKAASN